MSLLKIKHLAQRAGTHMGASALEQAFSIAVTACIYLEGTERMIFMCNAAGKELCWSVCFAPYKSKQQCIEF